jgi:hypothetical protein
MTAVHVAEDVKNHRRVAVKVVHPDDTPGAKTGAAA